MFLHGIFCYIKFMIYHLKSINHDILQKSGSQPKTRPENSKYFVIIMNYHSKIKIFTNNIFTSNNMANKRYAKTPLSSEPPQTFDGISLKNRALGQSDDDFGNRRGRGGRPSSPKIMILVELD
jgi:hypothetical protein